MTGSGGDTTTSGSGDVHRSLELLWGTDGPPSRGPKRGLTLDRIVTAAVGLADAEGLDAVSMRRLSTELGVGTMSLYRYVPGKAELLDLMLDRVQAPPPGTPGSPGDWREGVEALARGQLALYRRHPWLLKVNQSRSVLGPGALRALEAALAGLRGMGLSDPETLSVIIAVQSFTGGIARLEIEAAEAARETGVSDEAFWRSQEPVLARVMEGGEFPLMARLSEDTFSARFDHFEFGLRCLVRGFEARVAEARAGRGDAPSADPVRPEGGAVRPEGGAAHS
ncbi:TetR/AcrR family transcriptional regulator [Streptomyces somaliensis DSM 40738]|uniref:TetR/AcrR family transcriptional regulator n=1 Tax=Streptomyces somaliensis (strain ATCC 33201 / DSM 40738 / JCM 12659 / KCTC 9044 / NCTC 11332 / NRRL B-12077 / IP 733) TaxID=1134445 RepID=A0AA44DDY8_STRE0|nr:TetR/AcrR family transcriptional regulator [Streptomyces somaliensis]MCQ0023229.1 TetR/AcrR family transcriptional regulator [Streptomyces somaliensis DSM 40738]NKY14411.1 TetR/AcrR family transcriptional regulator [Streptomyces somaliensis DSM 40738]